ncbi:uncharacterized protein C7orf31 [Gouania willdenowi]|uniref:uncharacterized protein C7orf31 n=1 Tax=Gouania willdenowi TaxID=441366 RepID=UPI0010547CFB|nr:uncharacterized protein C7orf31 homolog [Gouania willdenowi]
METTAVSQSHMGMKPFRNHSIPSHLNGNHPDGHGETIPNVPKPTDINVGQIMKRTATLKEHPYSSHISRFALFPSFRSPDDPETGIRAASQTYLDTNIPNSAPEVTVLSKTIGGPYRHEIIESPMKTRKTAIRWTGTHGSLDHTKPLKGEKQVFYPAPPKIVQPNPKLRDWDLSLSERTCNMLKNMERALWLTSYQMHFTGSGPANPLKMDDFREKMSNLSGINPQIAPLQEKSYPAFVPSRPQLGRRRGLERDEGRSTCTPTSADFLQTHAEQPNQSTAIAPTEQPFGTTHELRTEETMSHSSHRADGVPVSNIQYPHKYVPYQTLHEFRSNSKQRSGNSAIDKMINKRLLPDPCPLLPRPPCLKGVSSMDGAGVVRRERTLNLRDLQNSFSKSEAHRNFNNSITYAHVNLRDNVVKGKKHNFNGLNCNYIHG